MVFAFCNHIKLSWKNVMNPVEIEKKNYLDSSTYFGLHNQIKLMYSTTNLSKLTGIISSLSNWGVMTPPIQPVRFGLHHNVHEAVEHSDLDREDGMSSPLLSSIASLTCHTNIGRAHPWRSTMLINLGRNKERKCKMMRSRAQQSNKKAHEQRKDHTTRTKFTAR